MSKPVDRLRSNAALAEDHAPHRARAACGRGTATRPCWPSWRHATGEFVLLPTLSADYLARCFGAVAAAACAAPAAGRSLPAHHAWGLDRARSVAAAPTLSCGLTAQRLSPELAAARARPNPREVDLRGVSVSVATARACRCRLGTLVAFSRCLPVQSLGAYRWPRSAEALQALPYSALHLIVLYVD